jgi:flagellar capping protein FliD
MEEKVIDYVTTYNNAMSSVNILTNGEQGEMSDEEWQGCIRANVDHLKIMLQIDWPEEFDLTPFEDAIAANEN